MPAQARAEADGARAYRRLFAAYALALIGTGVGVVGLALLAYEIEGEDAGGVIATALSIKVFCYVVIAPVAVVIVGGLPRTPLLVGLDLVRAAAILSLPFVTTLWQVYALVLAFTAASAAFMPLYQALVPALLPAAPDYARAVSKSRVANELENAASPLIAAMLLLVLDVRGLFVATMFAFLASAVLVIAARLPRVPPPPKAPLGRKLALGPRMLLADPRLRALVPLHLVAAAATAMVMVNTVVLVQADFGLDARATAVALAAFGAGSVIGAVVVPPLVARLAERWTALAGCALIVAGLFAGLAVDSYERLVLAWLAIGTAVALALTPAPLLLRRVVAAEQRPVLYAALFSLGNAALLVAYPIAGWLGATLGMATAFAVLAGIAAAAGVTTAALWPTEVARPH
jgi:predicted MFS family arabinose efflux permease